jgi:hypothetical protein
MHTLVAWDWSRYERAVALRCSDECLHESRMREICMSGSTRGEGHCGCIARFLLYSTVFALK